MTLASTWMELEVIMLSDINKVQIQKDKNNKYSMLLLQADGNMHLTYIYIIHAILSSTYILDQYLKQWDGKRSAMGTQTQQQHWQFQYLQHSRVKWFMISRVESWKKKAGRLWTFPFPRRRKWMAGCQVNSVKTVFTR